MKRWIYLFDKRTERLAEKYVLEKTQLSDLLAIIKNNSNDIMLKHSYDLDEEQVQQIILIEGLLIPASYFDTFDFSLECNF